MYYQGVGRRTGLLFLAMFLAASWSGVFAYDTVSDWNAIAEQAVTVAGHPPPVASLDFAIVQAAVYDAVVALDRRYEPYHVVIPRASGSPEAAAAKAAYDVLVYLFPAQNGSLTTTFSNYLATHGISPYDPGITVGLQAAAGIIALRSNDGRFPPGQPPFMGGTAAGVWRHPLVHSWTSAPVRSRPHALGGERYSFYDETQLPVSRRGAARSLKRVVCRRLQRGEGARRQV
jgi:hypothetical protein